MENSSGNNKVKEVIYRVSASSSVTNELPPPPPRPAPQPLGQAARDVLVALRDLLREEARATLADARSQVGNIGRPAVSGLVCGAIAFGGVLPLIAFLVISLGKLLGGNYALSSLVVGLVLAAIGLGAARFYFARAFKPIPPEKMPVKQARQTWDRTVDRAIRQTVNQVEDEVEKTVVSLKNSFVKQVREAADDEPFVTWAAALSVGVGLGLYLTEKKKPRAAKTQHRGDVIPEEAPVVPPPFSRAS